MIHTIAEYASAVASIVAALGIFVKPLREWLFGIKDIREAQKCSLRNQMLQIYREHKAERQLTEDEFKNFEMLFKAYKALGGNSFITKVWREIDTEWTIEV